MSLFIRRAIPKRRKWKTKAFYSSLCKARITNTNIPILFKDLFIENADILDKGIYNPNWRQYWPLSDRKRDNQILFPRVIDGSLLDCSATNIEENYLNLDVCMPKQEEFQLSINTKVKMILSMMVV